MAQIEQNLTYFGCFLAKMAYFRSKMKMALKDDRGPNPNQ